MKSFLVTLLLLSFLAWSSLCCCCADAEKDSDLCDIETEWDECPPGCSWYKSLSGDCKEVCKNERKVSLLEKTSFLKARTFAEARKNKYIRNM